jgi:hypothetical protein
MKQWECPSEDMRAVIRNGIAVMFIPRWSDNLHSTCRTRRKVLEEGRGQYQCDTNYGNDLYLNEMHCGIGERKGM